MNNRPPERSVMREGWPTVEAPITELLTRPLRAPPGGKNSSDEALHPAPQRFRLQMCVRRRPPACQGKYTPENTFQAAAYDENDEIERLPKRFG